MLALKVLGIIDIVTALAIYMNLNMLFMTVPLFVIHLAKGIMSLGADPLGKLYGFVDVLSAVAVLFVFNFPFFVEAFLVIILMFKGITSLF